MKTNSLVIAVLLGLCIKADAQHFTISGDLKDLKTEQKVILSYREGRQQVTDSAVTQNGVFRFDGEIARPTEVDLSLRPLKDDGSMTIEKMLSMDKQTFYLEPGQITVKGSAKMAGAEITGGATQKDYNLLQQQLKGLKQQMAPLSKQMIALYLAKDDSAQKALRPQLAAIRKEMIKIEDQFIYQHPDSYVSFDMVKSKAGVIDATTFEPYFNALSQRFKQSKEGQELGHRLDIARKIDIGQPALGFTQNNQEDEPVSLASFKGKYVLVDFWASWCGPCRAENPNVVKAYNKFKDRNFEIIGVSLDDKKAPWLAAIEKDGLPWVHVSDLKGWNNAVAKEYDVKAVPQNFLIDPEGKIIAKNLRGEQLDKTLTELIK